MQQKPISCQIKSYSDSQAFRYNVFIHRILLINQSGILRILGRQTYNLNVSCMVMEIDTSQE